MISRDQLLAPKLERKSVACPELGGDVFVQSMTSADRDSFDAEQHAVKDTPDVFKNFRARLVVRCIVDEAGNRVLSDQDAETFGRQNARVVDRIFDVARELSGIGSDVEDTAKNS